MVISASNMVDVPLLLAYLGALAVTMLCGMAVAYALVATLRLCAAQPQIRTDLDARKVVSLDRADRRRRKMRSTSYPGNSVQKG